MVDTSKQLVVFKRDMNGHWRIKAVSVAPNVLPDVPAPTPAAR
jgi:hypothetical protein